MDEPDGDRTPPLPIGVRHALCTETVTSTTDHPSDALAGYVPRVDELLPGVYEHLVTRGLAAQVAALDPQLVGRTGLDEADAHTVLTRHLAGLASRALRQVGTGPDALARQVELANRLTQAIVDAAPRAATVDDLTDPAADVLLDIAPNVVSFRPRADRPKTPLSASALLVNGHGQPRIGHEVVRELASAAGVDLLCAFIKWEGLRILLGRLDETLSRVFPVRVLTTTYIGATQRRALDALVELGAEVRISYDTRSTRLHARRNLTGAPRWELTELVDVLRERIHHVTLPAPIGSRAPLRVHARYNQTAVSCDWMPRRLQMQLGYRRILRVCVAPPASHRRSR